VLGQKLRDDLKAFDRDEKSLLATLNATLHRPLAQAIVTPSKLQALAAPKDLAPLQARARRERPLLRQLSARARTARAVARRAAREGYPDITAWLGYRFRVASGADPGTDFVTLGVSVPLPFSYARRFGSQRRESQALARAVEAQRSATIDLIGGALARARARWQRAAQKAESYQRKLMPLAHRALDATFAAYQVDRADFASLYQAELALLDFERAIRRARIATHIERATVRALVGASGLRQEVQ
jgi:cobalt-zinc-cadmium efflux system outer membrane protein